MLIVVIIFAIAAVHCVQAHQNLYNLHTKKNYYLAEFLIPLGTLPSNSLFNPEDRTILLIHGHRQNQTSAFNTLNKDVILGLPEPTNVIVVDWGFHAGFSYSESSARVPNVARDLDHFIRWLHESVGVDVSKVHLVGFGLGAHVAGIAARWYQQFGSNLILNKGVGRITGLDPSGSGWDGSYLALKASDATYVEVIHTDGSGLLSNGIGTAIGQINFYANGGNNQPGCLTNSCSHNRAYELFAASLINPNLEGSSCNSMTQMNLNTCRGPRLHMGGTEISKIFESSSQIYRINTGRTFPY